MPRLDLAARKARARRNVKAWNDKRKRIRQLCAGLDELIERAESKPKSSGVRERYLRKADSLRQELREIDH